MLLFYIIKCPCRGHWISARDMFTYFFVEGFSGYFAQYQQYLSSVSLSFFSHTFIEKIQAPTKRNQLVLIFSPNQSPWYQYCYLANFVQATYFPHNLKKFPKTYCLGSVNLEFLGWNQIQNWNQIVDIVLGIRFNCKFTLEKQIRCYLSGSDNGYDIYPWKRLKSKW